MVQWLCSEHRHFRQYFIGRQTPIHWNRATILCWTKSANLAGHRRTADDLNFATGDNVATDYAVAFLIERVPLPVSIETLQDLQFVPVQQFEWRKQCHIQRISVISTYAQSGESRIDLSVKDLRDVS